MRHAARRAGTGPAAVLAGLLCSLVWSLAGSAAAEAQSPMPEERCKTLMTIITGVTLEYAGQISSDFVSDLQRKVGTEGKCDGPDEYRIWPNTKDREALGRIRQLLMTWDICQKEPAREGCKE